MSEEDDVLTSLRKVEPTRRNVYINNGETKTRRISNQSTNSLGVGVVPSIAINFTSDDNESILIKESDSLFNTSVDRNSISGRKRSIASSKHSVKFQVENNVTINPEPSNHALNHPKPTLTYSSTLLPILIDPSERLEENRRTSIAVLQNKVKQYGGRRYTVQDKVKSWLLPAQTPTNVKIFGGKRAVQEEQIRSKDAGWVIHPYSNLRYHWDLFIMVLLAINMYVLPLNIAFLETTNTWIAFEVTLFILFFMDIILNFRTGFKEENNGYRLKIILEPKAIFIRYAKTWLVLDFISSLPLDLFTYAYTGGKYDKVSKGVKSASNALKFLRLTKLLSLLKLLRMTRFVRIISKYEEFYRLTASIVRYIKLVLCMLLVAHWNGCLAFFIPLLEGFPSKCWVRLNRLEEAPWEEQYGWALFKALSHMLCIGYGRFIPQLLSEAIITIFSMITGATFYALFIAHSMAYLQQNDSARRQFQEKFKQIEEYMCYRNLPISTRERITDYYEHKYTQKRLFNEEEILSEVSPPLRNDIVNHNCRDLVEKVPFLKEGGPDFVSLVITKLTFDVYLPGDTVIKEGTFGNDMYFIRYGMVDVISDGNAVTSLTEGEYFGEITMLTGARRVASIKAVTVCNLFILHKDNLFLALDEFPDMRVLMEHVALDRLIKLRHKHPTSVCGNRDTAVDDLEDRLNEYNEDNKDDEGENQSRESIIIPINNINTQTTKIQIEPLPTVPVFKPTVKRDSLQMEPIPTAPVFKPTIKRESIPSNVLRTRKIKPLDPRRYSHEPTPTVLSNFSIDSRTNRSLSVNLDCPRQNHDGTCDCEICNRDLIT